MKRIEFIIQFIGLAGFGWLVPASLKKPAAKRYTLYEGWIAGYQYYNGPEVEERLAAGQPLQLRREPGNNHDRRAIEIYAGSAKLGYIPRVDNHVLAALMDHGEKLRAEVAKVRPCKPVWGRVRVRIRFNG